MKRFTPACLGLSAILLASCGSVADSITDKANVGPCPVAATLYDAARVVDIEGAQRHENVKYTGAVEGVRGYCRYIESNPITMEVEADFAFGKGPKATESTHTYPVFITIMRRDKSVLAKQEFNIEVSWPAGKDIVRHTETIPGIVIPRANDTVSGSNFEIFVGFELTPEELAYNRSGARFTINVAKPPAPK